MLKNLLPKYVSVVAFTAEEAKAKAGREDEPFDAGSSDRFPTAKDHISGASIWMFKDDPVQEEEPVKPSELYAGWLAAGRP